MKLKIILPIAAVALLLVGVVLLALTLGLPKNEFVKDLTLNDSDVTQENIELSANGLIPGDSREYTLNFKGKATGNYSLSFEFVEVGQGALKDFVDVTLQCGENVYSYKLAQLLDGTSVNFHCRISTQEVTVVKIIYSMSEDVGNGAQNATADFTINITAKKG